MTVSHTYADQRRRFPPDRIRSGFIHKGKISIPGGDVEYYITANFFDDGTLGEIFVKIAKQGSELAGWVNAWAVTVSIALQHGVPWEILRTKYLDQQFGGSIDAPSTLHAIATSVDELIAQRNQENCDVAAT